MEKLVRGVIYDDVNAKELKDEMFYLLEHMDNMDRDCVLEEHLESTGKDLDISTRDVNFMFKNMDAIAALTRLNKKTFETHNMIIPKESLSKNMVEELSTVDLGKNLLDDYTRHYFKTYGVEKYEEEEEYVMVSDPKTGEYILYLPKKDFDECMGRKVG